MVFIINNEKKFEFLFLFTICVDYWIEYIFISMVYTVWLSIELGICGAELGTYIASAALDTAGIEPVSYVAFSLSFSFHFFSCSALAFFFCLSIFFLLTKSVSARINQ